MGNTKDSAIVGLDIGTTKICAIVGVVSNGEFEVIGLGTEKSRGLRRGVVVNIDSTVHSISKAITEAEAMAACSIQRVFVGIAGCHIKGTNAKGIIAVKGDEVTQADVDRVREQIKQVEIPLDREVIHMLPREYLVDEQDGIIDPVGIHGKKLESRVHIITASVTSVKNIVRCCYKSNLDVSDIVLQPYASALATLVDEERDLGVVLVDIGGGTTDIAIFHNGSLDHTQVLGIGGNQITGDIAIGLRTPMFEAEKIKCRYGCAMASMVDRGETIEVPGVGGRKPKVIARHILCEIIEPRVEEIFQLVQRELQKSGLEEQVASGVVLTGGAAQMDGMCELAEEVLGMQVRKGVPRNLGGLKDLVRYPEFSTAAGLGLYGMGRRSTEDIFKRNGRGVFKKVLERMKRWWTDMTTQPR